jgi:hypothetical protein
MHDRFFDVPRTTATTTAGPVELPILYHDVSNLIALFRARRAVVEGLLAGTGLVPALGLGGDAMVALSYYEYRGTSIGPYNEVGLAAFVRPASAPAPRLAIADLYRRVGARTIGAYVIDLPVTTSIANAGGRELWGYPKFVTPISFHLDHRRFESAIADPDGAAPIAVLAGRLGLGVPAPPMSLVTFSVRQGDLVRTHIDVRGRVRARGPGELRLDVGESRHPMADRLRRLGLDGARPLVVMTTDRFQSRLNAGVVIAARSGVRAVRVPAPLRPVPPS